MKKDKLDIVDSKQVATLILGPILRILDMALTHKPEFLDIMKKQLSAMSESTGFLAAWPFPETMDKAKDQEIMNKTFDKIIELAEIRKEYIDYKKNKSNLTPGQDVLRQLGY